MTELVERAAEARAGAVPVVRCEQIRKSFGDNLVLDGIDLSVSSGEVLVVIGPSGSGKSTLLRCVNLLEPLDSGRIYLEGDEITAKGADVSAIRQPGSSSSSSTSSRTSARSTTSRSPRGGSGGSRARRPRPRHTSCWRAWASRRRRASTRTSSQAASSSGWRSPAR